MHCSPPSNAHLSAAAHALRCNAVRGDIVAQAPRAPGHRVPCLADCAGVPVMPAAVPIQTVRPRPELDLGQCTGIWANSGRAVLTGRGAARARALVHLHRGAPEAVSTGRSAPSASPLPAGADAEQRGGRLAVTEMIIDSHCHAGKGDGLTGPWTPTLRSAPTSRAARRDRPDGPVRRIHFGLPERERGRRPHRYRASAAVLRVCHGGRRPGRGQGPRLSRRRYRLGRMPHQGAPARRPDYPGGLRGGAVVRAAGALRRDGGASTVELVAADTRGSRS